MNDEQLLRYSRHILLDELGVDGQTRLLESHALIVGAGGLGSPVALYLASAGVGTITIADDDTVDLTNLQRQIAHDSTTIGLPKVQSAAQRMRAINPDIRVLPLNARLKEESLSNAVAAADVVIDCSDRFVTRHAINRACVRHKKPLASGAAIRFDGQLSVYDVRRDDSPCYACLFPDEDLPEEERCATMGVFAPLVGIIGSMQAAEAIKVLSGTGTPLAGKLLTLDALTMETMTVSMSRNPTCAVCRGAHE
ncbi:MAG: HesA/MoeB/ThiF family protein [Casimicrobium sp.]